MPKHEQTKREADLPARSSTSEQIEDEVSRWVEACVIGLDLCPFAAAPFREDRVAIKICKSKTQEGAVSFLLAQIEKLIMTPPRKLSNTLVVFSDAFGDFEDFLDALATFNGLLAQSALVDAFQIASFHPNYHFSDSPPDARGNLTNRAPYPIFHLLREDEVTDAVMRYKNPEQIPTRNISRLETLDLAEIASRWPFIDPSSLLPPENA